MEGEEDTNNEQSATHDDTNQDEDNEPVSPTADDLRAELEELKACRAREQEEFELRVQCQKEVLELERQRHQNQLELERQQFRGQLDIQQMSTPKTHHVPPKHDVPAFSPILPQGEPLRDLLEFSRLQHQAQLDTMRLPPADIIKFDGDPLKYWQFVRLFTSLVDKDTVADGEKLTRLYQYTTGKAKDAIAHCLYNADPSMGFTDAWGRLKERFGNSHMVAQAWVDRILQHKEVRDNTQLRDFADQLRGCRDTLVAMGCPDELSGRRSLLEIVQKLPPDIRSKWLNENYRIVQSGRIPKLDDVVTFVEREADKRSDPVFGCILGGSGTTQSSKQPTNKNKKEKRQQTRNTFATNVKPDCQPVKVTSTSSTSTYKPTNYKCPQCNESHYLNQCQAFRSLSVKDRLEFVQRKKLCENCFQPGHIGETCSRPWVCNIDGCGRKHNRWLHPPARNHPQSASSEPVSSLNKQPTNQNNASNVTCGYAGAGTGKVCLPIVPVIVKGVNQGISTVTYALLDTGANQSLISEKLITQLGVKSTKTYIRLNTVESQDVKTPSFCVDLTLQSLQDSFTYPLTNVMSLPSLNISLDSLVTDDELAKWSHLHDLHISKPTSDNVQLIIGQDASHIIKPLEIRVGTGNEPEPYATRTVLGWAINGPVDSNPGGRKASSYFLKADVDLQKQVERFWKLDDPFHGDEVMSVSDRKVLNVWESSSTKVGSHYSFNIPFKQNSPCMPNNYFMAKHRLDLLGRRLAKDPQLREQYVEGIHNNLGKGYAEEVPPESLERDDGKVWYLPHHPVLNPRKPGKMRIVYDCAARYQGKSLNDCVFQGPDLNNKLIGVLLRFREEPVAITADVEGMFNQVQVPEEDRDVLRFLWWEDDNPNKPVKIYRMTTHLFGGVWSPSCATFALKHTAADNCDRYEAATIKTVDQNFYVDDCLKSVATEKSAIELTRQLRELLACGGFHLTKWLSNSRAVMKSIPEEEWAKVVASLNLDKETLPSERTLGVLWQVEADNFSFETTVKDNPATKRGLLSVTSSIYDPLGFASPFIMSAKMMFQNLCRLKVNWDDPIPDDLAEQWARWLNDLPELSNLAVPRCLKSESTSTLVSAQLHHFSDASERGYGAVSYLRTIDQDKQVHCALVMSKAKLAPLKTTTIPRLELTAAVTSVKLDKLIRQHLQLPLIDSVFWTDSTIVLQYLRNEEKRFQTFVANRIAQIHEQSSPSQWRYVDTYSNPGDDVSRGMSAADLVNDARWVRGPPFLWKEEEDWPLQPDLDPVSHNADAEIKKEARIYHTKQSNIVPNIVDKLFARYSSWHRLKKAVAWILRAKDILLRRKAKPGVGGGPITVDELQRAEIAVIVYVQRASLSAPKLQNLSPITDKDEILRVGGRLKNAPIPYSAKHQAILPRHHQITDMIIRHYHELYGHAGTERILAEVRQKFWPIRGRATVKSVIHKCMDCRKRKASPEVQMMSDLPQDRVTSGEPPFSSVGVDYFGPFLVKRGRSQQKRYGCLFTCLVTRAIHIEISHSLDTDSFINALQRFIARRGSPNEIRSDNGTNFVGARKELKAAITDWNQQRVADYLLQREIRWIFNPPTASHMGGVWERQIRTVRSILLSLPSQQTLDDEQLCTLMCIAESIVNGRPITKLSDDPKDAAPLTPNHLLLLKASPTLPPGRFVKQDAYRRRWRQVQYLADQFWTRWTKEYLPGLQERQKWLTPHRNLHPGDLVLVLHENTPRCQWPLALVTDVFPGKDGLVRTVNVKTQTGLYTRPIHKLCLLEANLV